MSTPMSDNPGILKLITYTMTGYVKSSFNVHLSVVIVLFDIKPCTCIC